jgi:tetratricopeptide (TPR) repeat protein
VSTDLRDRLQASLGSAYTLERELGGGGMSRVFVALETALGRRVVIKVLPPELTAGVSVDRFKREIQVAARLQHPHIVPVLSAGEIDGLPYYTMPFVEGSSLRARLVQGPLPVTEATGILREVARALAYAHEHGVVHRDIKPDNVLLTGGSAVVTDFGIAKALSASRLEGPGSPTLTAMGTSLGTPTYMAPEQAAGDPATDHRADLYAFGCMAYELLAGRPPFHGLTPHKLMAAHMGERPQPVTELRPDIPPVLADLVMRCLEKEPDHRPQGAADLARVLETVTSSGTAQAALPSVLLGGRGMLMRALAIYTGAFVAVAVLAKAAIVGIGLPDWVFPGALIVMALGLPVILFTGYVQRATRRAFTQTPTLTPGGSTAAPGTMATIALKAAPVLSWRRTAMGGVWAVAAFIVLIAAWMAMRALGIGPAASLMASGKLGDKERVIVGDFKNSSQDSLLASTVTEAFRTDLAQSQNLVVMPANAVREALQLMQRPVNSRLDYALTREIATREGIKAVIDGEVLALGGSYVLSARLLSAQTGEQLATFRETASDDKDIIAAISRLTKDVRERVGESLRDIQNARTLDKVTTPSLAALQKYVASMRALEGEGDWDKGKALLEEAIALDTGFAMAYRKLAVELNNRGLDPARVTQLIQKAYDHRDRLSESERYLTIAGYYAYGPQPDNDRVIQAYESLLDIDPDNVTALNNLAVRYQYRREFARAEELARHAVNVDSSASVFFFNLYNSRMYQGKVDSARAAVARFARNLPRNPQSAEVRAQLAYVTGHLDSATAIADSLRRARSGDAPTRGDAESFLSAIEQTQGHLAAAVKWSRQAAASYVSIGAPSAALGDAVQRAAIAVWFRADTAGALGILNTALTETPLDSLPLLERPYDNLAWAYSLAGNVERAKVMLAAYERRSTAAPRIGDNIGLHATKGAIALAEGRYDAAITELRAADSGFCVVCAPPELARAWDLSGNADSAIAEFERYVDMPGPTRVFSDNFNLAGALNRLGQLYDAKGDRQKATSYYARFVDLWKTADPELQPIVKKARDRLAELQRAERP